MRPRTLLILFLAVAGLGAFVWFYERDLPSSEERAEQAKKVLRFTKSEVTALAVDRGGSELTLERVSPTKAAAEDDSSDAPSAEGSEDAPPVENGSEDLGEWRIAKPIAARADTSMVASLLDALLAIEKNRTIEDPDPKELGLDKPQATVRVTTGEGIEVVKVGAKVPTGASMILAVEGRPEAYVVSDALLTNLDRAPGDWRDRQVLHAKRDDVERVALTGEHGRVVLARKGGGFWIESPVADRADHDLVESLLSDLSGLTAQTFVDAPTRPAELGLEPPRGRVEVFAKGAQPLRIELGAPAAGAVPAASGEEAPQSPSLYARAGAQVFETQTGLTDAVARLPEDWRSRSLTGLEVYQVESLRARDGKGEIALARAGTDWKRGTETISYTPVSDLLFAATGARAERLVTPEEAQAMGAALDRPVLTLALKGESGEETLTLYPPVGEEVPARAAGRNVVLLLPKAVLEDLQKQVAAVRAAKPVPPSGGEGDEKAEG